MAEPPEDSLLVGGEKERKVSPGNQSLLLEPKEEPLDDFLLLPAENEATNQPAVSLKEPKEEPLDAFPAENEISDQSALVLKKSNEMKDCKKEEMIGEEKASYLCPSPPILEKNEPIGEYIQDFVRLDQNPHKEEEPLMKKVRRECKENDTDLECPECEYRTKSPHAWEHHLNVKHFTTPILANLVFRCVCGTETFSSHHSRKCDASNITIFRIPPYYESSKSTFVPKKDIPTVAVTTPQCVICKVYPTTLSRYIAHLYSFHKSTPKEINIFLKCDCGLKFTDMKTVERDKYKHSDECDPNQFTLHKLDGTKAVNESAISLKEPTDDYLPAENKISDQSSLVLTKQREGNDCKKKEIVCEEKNSYLCPSTPIPVKDGPAAQDLGRLGQILAWGAELDQSDKHKNVMRKRMFPTTHKSDDTEDNELPAIDNNAPSDGKHSMNGQKRTRKKGKKNDTDLECTVNECEYRAESVTAWEMHIRFKHQTTPKQADLALRCTCGNESFSSSHSKKGCDGSNTVFHVPPNYVLYKSTSLIKNVSPSEVVTTPQCILCEAYPKSIATYFAHLSSCHKSLAKEHNIYLKCDCGLKFHCSRNVETDKNKHTKECNPDKFTLHKLEEKKKKK